MPKLITLTAVAAMLSPLSLLGQLKADNDPASERFIRSLEAERRVALLKQDRAALDRMYSSDMSTIDNDGEIHSNIGKDAVNLNSPATRSVTVWDPDQVQVRVYGDVAIVTQRVHTVDQINGQKRDVYLRLTHSWVKRDGQWQIVARHGSEIRAKVVSSMEAAVDHALDRQSIDRIVAATSDAWNQRDVKGLVAHSTDDIDHIGVTGGWTSGKAALEKMFIQVVPTIRNTVTAAVERIRFLSPDIAVAQIRRQYRSQVETREAIGTSVFQKINGEWLVTAFQNTLSLANARSSLDTARLDATQSDGASRGLSSNSVRRIGVLFRGYNSEVSLAPGSPRMDTLRAALSRLGYHEGRDIIFVSRAVAAEPDSLSKAARELANDSVDLIVAGGSTEALFAGHATSRIPIVFWSAEPIAEGLVSSLERPGRDSTGIIPAKSAEAERLEMLNLVAPGSAPIGVLYNPTYLPGVGVLRRARSAADSLGIQLNVVEAQSLPQMDSAFAVFKRNRVRAVLINNHGLFRINAAHLAALSLSYKLPMLSPYPEARDAGTLISSVPDFVFWSRRAARYIDRILRGANPAELAVEESVPQHFTINLKTAAELRIAIPEEVMRRAEAIR